MTGLPATLLGDLAFPALAAPMRDDFEPPPLSATGFESAPPAVLLLDFETKPLPATVLDFVATQPIAEGLLAFASTPATVLLDFETEPLPATLLDDFAISLWAEGLLDFESPPATVLLDFSKPPMARIFVESASAVTCEGRLGVVHAHVTQKHFLQVAVILPLAAAVLPDFTDPALPARAFDDFVPPSAVACETAWEHLHVTQ